MLSIEINTNQIDKDINRVNRSIESALVRSVQRGIDWLGEQQIGVYTQDDKPPKPSGSPYVRTFDMQNSMDKRLTNRTLPNISGVFEVKIDYAEYVVGDKQAQIHQGRWLSNAELEAMLIDQMDDIVREEITRALR